MREFTIELQGKTIQWTKSPSASWHAVEVLKESAGDYSVTNTIVTVLNKGKGSKTDISQFLKLGKEPDLGRIRQIEVAGDSLGTPILIQRERRRIMLSQQKGALFEKPAVISWKTKEQRPRSNKHDAANSAQLTYAYSDSFLKYFGQKGVAEVERALEIARNPKIERAPKNEEIDLDSLMDPLRLDYDRSAE